MASLLRRRSAWNWSTRCKSFRSILAMASPTIPVAIMTYGSADMMGVPWETIVKIYAKRLGSRTFETLEHYAKDFLTFVEEATTLFPAENQKSWVADVVGDVWSGLYQGKLQERMKKTPNASDVIGTAALLDLIHKDHKDWAHYPNLEEIGADYGARVLQTYADVTKWRRKFSRESNLHPRLGTICERLSASCLRKSGSTLMSRAGSSSPG
jgi:hypothetical protein